MNILYEFEAEQFLRNYGIDVPKSIKTNDLNEVLKFFEDNNGCVIKPADKLHKSEYGVFICRTKEEVISAYEKLNRFVYCAEILQGFELFLGGNISEFGKIILIGWGGIYTEVLKDYVGIKIPVDKESFFDILKENTKVWKVLEGYRGKKYNLNALWDTFDKIQNMFLKENIKEFDINPLFINEERCVVGDARIIFKE